MALHEQCVGATDEWHTPPHIFEKLGCTFDTDAASPGQHITPWIKARTFITRNSSMCSGSASCGSIPHLESAMD